MLSGYPLQKGITGFLYDESDMPSTADGIKPDMIFNPLSLITRMTMGVVFEGMLAKLSAHTGVNTEATMFKKLDTDDTPKIGRVYDLKVKIINSSNLDARENLVVELIVPNALRGKVEATTASASTGKLGRGQEGEAKVQFKILDLSLSDQRITLGVRVRHGRNISAKGELELNPHD